MKKAIFTLAIGDENPMYRAALLSFEQYAQKVGADLIVSKEFHYPITITDPQHTASPAWTENEERDALLNSLFTPTDHKKAFNNFISTRKHCLAGQ